MIKGVPFASLLFPLVAFSYPLDQAQNNLAHELAECGAYYTLVSETPGLDEKTKQGLSGFGTVALEGSAELTSQKVALARFDLALQTMTREMDKDWSNLSVVNAKYGYLCQDLLKDPEQRMQYWLEK